MEAVYPYVIDPRVTNMRIKTLYGVTFFLTVPPLAPSEGVMLFAHLARLQKKTFYEAVWSSKFVKLK